MDICMDMYLDIIGYILDNFCGYVMDIWSGYSIWISMDILGYILDILGYLLDKYQWISLMDMWLWYLWICLHISRISPVDIFSWISLKDILFCPKISKRYPFISNDIQRYPTISNDIQRYPNGANSQMMDWLAKPRSVSWGFCTGCEWVLPIV